MGSGEVLFYVGLILMAAAAAFGVLALIVLKVRAGRLCKTLDKEYGPQITRKPSVPEKLDG